MAETNTSTKTCTKCKVEQQVSNFHNDKNRKDGKFPQCKGCLKGPMKTRYLENREAELQKRKENYEKNKDAYKARAKKWAEENPELRREVRLRYDHANKDKKKIDGARHRQLNPGLYAAHYKARQQRKRKAMPAWANEENIKAIYRQCAWVSRITGIKHHVDHYYPLKSDSVCGLHNEFNSRIIPAFDNLSKGNRVLQ